MTAIDPVLERCACGAALNPTIEWCPQCYQPRASGAPGPRFGSAGPSDARFGPAAGDPHTVPLPAPPARRYGATALTFGLPMRLLLTALATVPMAGFVALAVWFGGVIMCVVVLGAYGGFLYPRLMKDIWRRSDRPISR